MGHCNSSTQLGSHGGFRSHGTRADETASPSSRGSGPERQTNGIDSAAKSAPAWILLLLVRFYIAFLSPFLGGACKFHPSCSNYAYEAIQLHGAKRGSRSSRQAITPLPPLHQGGL